MKGGKLIFVAAALSMISFAGVAADQINFVPADQHKVGVVSATGSTNLISLESQLAEKASTAGVKSFPITSISGSNNLHGIAAIYN